MTIPRSAHNQIEHQRARKDESIVDKQRSEPEYSLSARLSAHHSLEYRTRLSTATDLAALCRINYELFARSPFAATLPDIETRNRSIFEANPLSFALVEAKVHDAFVPVGMSAILPLNGDGESAYCRTGGLADIALRGRHIASPGEWSDAVVIFIVGFTREVRGLLRDRPLTAIAHVLYDHGTHVVSSMRVHRPERRSVRLLAQTNRANGGMNRLFQHGAKDTGIITGDGYPLQELWVDLPPTDIPARAALSGEMLSSLRRVTTARSAADMAAPSVPDSHPFPVVR